MFSRILIANRGEIAVRVARTCRELDVETVAVYSDPDAGAMHVEAADDAVHLPGTSAQDTYLNLDAVLDAAERTGAEAVHPGYGFFSERADAAEAVIERGLSWIGPPPDATRSVGDKIRARQIAQDAGVEPVPGTQDAVHKAGDIHAFGERYGYPVAIKASGGGGGRGLRVVRAPDETQEAFDGATREAAAYFGSPGVYLERYLERPKHIEIQILAPAPGAAMWLGARDCSLQRRHQKLVEETPPPRFVDLVPTIGEAAVAVANACGYVNAGTVEFLVDEEGGFYFLEVNARLQVEHTITEEVLGIDLVAAQLRIASGEPVGFGQDELEPRGHAIECRINAEDPGRKFLPKPGRIERYREPGGIGVRVDSGYREGDTVPAAYDSLLAKLIVWAPTREEARKRMLRALSEFHIEGIPTTIPAHQLLLSDTSFVEGTYTTTTVEDGVLEPLARKSPAQARSEGMATPKEASAAVLLVGGAPVKLWNPAMAGSSSGAAKVKGVGTGGAVVAPMHGTVLKLLVAEGDEVEAGDPVAILEAMKMETHLAAPTSGTVQSINVEPGEIVEAGQAVASIG